MLVLPCPGPVPPAELVLRPVISLPASDSLPTHLQHAAAVAPPQRPLTSQAVWQQIIGGQQHLAATSPRAQFQHQSLLARGGRSISDPVALQQALEEAQAYKQQQQAAVLQQATGSPLGSGGLLGCGGALAATQTAAQQLPGSPKLGCGGMVCEVQPQRAISAPASELWAYAAELSAEAGTPQAVQQRWQRQQATSVAAGQGHGASDFSFNWMAPTAAVQSPVLGVAPAPAAPLLPPQYWPQQ